MAYRGVGVPLSTGFVYGRRRSEGFPVLSPADPCSNPVGQAHKGVILPLSKVTVMQRDQDAPQASSPPTRACS